jgi:hypothetical protein
MSERSPVDDALDGLTTEQLLSLWDRAWAWARGARALASCLPGESYSAWLNRSRQDHLLAEHRRENPPGQGWHPPRASTRVGVPRGDHSQRR